jgi:hypothetical protein
MIELKRKCSMFIKDYFGNLMSTLRAVNQYAINYN